jgi:DNA-binding NtrC family response regulator
MKRRDKTQLTTLRRFGVYRPRRSAGVTENDHLLQVHPIPRSRYEILAIAVHFARCFATTQGKPAPDFSEEAATFLVGQHWEVAELATRVSHAVASNRGNLITATDLSRG